MAARLGTNYLGQQRFHQDSLYTAQQVAVAVVAEVVAVEAVVEAVVVAMTALTVQKAAKTAPAKQRVAGERRCTLRCLS